MRECFDSSILSATGCRIEAEMCGVRTIFIVARCELREFSSKCSKREHIVFEVEIVCGFRMRNNTGRQEMA